MTTSERRSTYFDLLRAIAIFRVVVYHATGWAWFTVLFPSMGVMFGLAGSLMAASLSRGRSTVHVLRSRLRRLLLPFWLFGAGAVFLMWAQARHTGEWKMTCQCLYWVVPVVDPPGSDWGAPLWEVLWYLRAYLWFVLLSPLLLPLFRRIPYVVLAVPFALLLVLENDLWSLSEPMGTVVDEFCTYAGCWLLGFAHREGTLDRLGAWGRTAIASALAAAGAVYAVTHQTEEGLDLGYIPIGNALWSAAFVIVLLGFSPRLEFLKRVPRSAAFLRRINSRALTIYLWHNPLIAVSVFLIALAGPRVLPYGVHTAVLLALVAVLTTGAVIATGWVENYAAGGRKNPRSREEPEREAVQSFTH